MAQDMPKCLVYNLTLSIALILPRHITIIDDTHEQASLLVILHSKNCPNSMPYQLLHLTQLYISFTLAVGGHHSSSPLIVPLIKLDQIRIFLVIKR